MADHGGFNSICVITAVRIRVTKDIADHARTANYSLLALLATLENTLGVLNACLPTLKPVLDKVFASSIWSSTSDITTKAISSVAPSRMDARKGGATVSRKTTSRSKSFQGNDTEDLQALSPGHQLQRV